MKELSSSLNDINRILTSHPFVVSSLLQNYFVQTIGSITVPYFKIKDLRVNRKYIDLPDGTKLGADCIFQPDYKKKSTVVVLDGYGGSSTSPFSLGIGYKAYHYGFNVILLNQRGQGDTVHFTKSLSDSGLLGDVSFALDEFVQWGCESLYIAGFSWGGSLALLELGKKGKRFQKYIKGLVLMSVPIDIVNYSNYNERKEFSFFNWVATREWDKWVKRRLKIDPPGTWDKALRKKKRSIRQWDEAYMHAWGNFKTVDDYYLLVTQLPCIPNIKIPTLAIHSYDDPIIPADQFNAPEFKNNSQFITLLSSSGAHGGFVTAKKRYGDLDRHWAQNRAIEFLCCLKNRYYLSIDLIKKILYSILMLQHTPSDIFSALADPTRRTIIEMLSEKGQLSASDISNKFHMSPPAVSQHLKVLRETHIVNVEKRAQQRIYTINPDAMDELEMWVKKLKSNWEERFDVLDKLLEREISHFAKGSRDKKGTTNNKQISKKRRGVK